MLRRVYGASRLAQLPRSAVKRVPNGPKLMFARALSSSAPASGVPSWRELEKQPLPPSFIERFKLYEPTRWVPLTVGSFLAASATGLYHWDAESQMLGLFVLFVGTIYTQLGAPIGKYFDDISDGILKEQRDFEQKSIDQLNAQILHLKTQMTLYDDLNGNVDWHKDIMAKLAAAHPKLVQRELERLMLAKLEMVEKKEAELQEKFQKEIIAAATQEVTGAYSKNADLQKDSLTTAIAQLKDVGSADQTKQAKDVSLDKVGQMFKDFFSKKKTELKSKGGKEFELPADLLKSFQNEVEASAKSLGVAFK